MWFVLFYTPVFFVATLTIWYQVMGRFIPLTLTGDTVEIGETEFIAQRGRIDSIPISACLIWAQCKQVETLPMFQPPQSAFITAFCKNIFCVPYQKIP